MKRIFSFVLFVIIVLILSGCIALWPPAEIKIAHNRKENLLLVIDAEDTKIADDIIRYTENAAAEYGIKVEYLYINGKNSADEVKKWADEHPKYAYIVYVGWGETAEKSYEYLFNQGFWLGCVNLTSESNLPCDDSWGFVIDIDYASFGESAAFDLLQNCKEREGKVLLINNTENTAASINNSWNAAFKQEIVALGSSVETVIIEIEELDKYIKDYSDNEVETIKAIVAYSSMNLGGHIIGLSDVWIITVSEDKNMKFGECPTIIYEPILKSVGEDIINEGFEVADYAHIEEIYTDPVIVW